ncbi:conserved hypothetical protein [Burkholderiales bacterium]|nr:conserved hypothetical protein [Burkholderiales bacterium]
MAPVKTAKKRAGKAAAKPSTRAPVKAAKKRAGKAAAKPTSRASFETAKVPPGAAALSQKPTKKGNDTKDNKRAKPKKTKLIRDSFTIPESEYDLFAALKKRCLAQGLAVKKSEVLRAAIIGFAAQSDSVVTSALRAVEVLKTGRPPKVQK